VSASRAERRRASSGSWLVSVVLLVVLSLPLIGLGPLLQGSGWWFSAAAFMGAVLGVAALLRALGLPWYVPILGAAATWILISTFAFAPGTAAFLLFPTRETLDTILAGFYNAGASISEQRIPAAAVPPIVQLIAMVTGLIAVLADAVVHGARIPAIVGIVPVVMLAIPQIVKKQDLNVVLFIAVAGSYLLLLWLAARLGVTRRHLSRRPRRSGRAPATAVGLGAVAIVVALVIPNVTPGLTADAFEDDQPGNQFPSVYAVGVDPFIQLGRDLRRSSPVLSLSYTTSSSGPLYLKLVNLTDFSKGTWGPEDPTAEAEVSDREPIASAPGLDPAVKTEEIESTISIASLRSDWLPTPYPTTTIDGLRGQWLVSGETLTVSSGSNDSRGENYRASSLAVEPTPEQLAAAGSIVPPGLGRFLSVPDDLPSIIASTANEVTTGALTSYDKAVALQKYFTSGEFTYSVQAPVDGDFDGDNREAMAAFLTQKEGYCVHFASTMAVMARLLGIPSRVAVGYYPGGSSGRSANGSLVYDVTTDQLHAWPELYFEGIGWLPFEPTPSLGITPPDYSLPDYAVSGGSSGGAAADSGALQTGADNKGDAGEEAAVTGADVAAAQALAQLRQWLTIAGIVVIAALLCLVPALVRRVKRARSRRRISSGPSPGTAAWHELHDVANDYRFEVTGGDTPRSFAERLSAIPAMPDAELAFLLTTVEREQFARHLGEPAGTERRAQLQASLEAVVAAIARSADAGARRRAWFRPASLWVNRRTSGEQATS
jgi:hypothetical protein